MCNESLQTAHVRAALHAAQVALTAGQVVVEALFASAAALGACLPAAAQPVMGACSFWILIRQSLCLLCGNALQHFGHLRHQHALVLEVALSPGLVQGACRTHYT